MSLKELSQNEIRLKITDHFAEFIGKLTEEPDNEACLDFATTMLDAVALSVVSADKNGVITVKMQLKPIDELLAEMNAID